MELFNGHSDRMNQVVKKTKEKTVINVGLARGYWPFIRGDKFMNQCNLKCSSIYAKRSIDSGEELLLSFGDVSPAGFIFKYGYLPPDFLNHYNIMSGQIFPSGRHQSSSPVLRMMNWVRCVSSA